MTFPAASIQIATSDSDPPAGSDSNPLAGGATRSQREQGSWSETWTIVLPEQASAETLARALAWLMIRRAMGVRAWFQPDTMDIHGDGYLQITDDPDLQNSVDNLSKEILQNRGALDDVITELMNKRPVNRKESELNLPSPGVVRQHLPSSGEDEKVTTPPSGEEKKVTPKRRKL